MSWFRFNPLTQSDELLPDADSALLLDPFVFLGHMPSVGRPWVWLDVTHPPPAALLPPASEREQLLFFTDLCVLAALRRRRESPQGWTNEEVEDIVAQAAAEWCGSLEAVLEGSGCPVATTLPRLVRIARHALTESLMQV